MEKDCTIKLLDKFVTEVEANGGFYKVRMPKGTIIDGVDAYKYTLNVNPKEVDIKNYVQTGNRLYSIELNPEKLYQLEKSVLKEGKEASYELDENGEKKWNTKASDFETAIIKVKGSDLAEAIHKNQREFLESREQNRKNKTQAKAEPER